MSPTPEAATTRRTIYALTSGEYSDYGVHALYEDKADAEAVGHRLNGNGQWHTYEVRGFPYYSSGDRSFRPFKGFRALVVVAPDGTLDRSPEVRDDDGYEDGEGLLTGGELVWALGWDRAWGRDRGWAVVGHGHTKEQAIKGCQDRAAQVAALVVEGLDPLAVERGR